MGFVRNHSLLVFYALTLVTQVVAVALESEGRAPELLVRLRVYLPAIIAVAMIAAIDGRTGLEKLGTSLVRVRVPWRFWAFALLYAPVASILPLIAFEAVGLLPSIEIDWAVLRGSDLWFLKFVVTIAVVEEISWVSFGIDRIAKKTTPFVAGILGGAVWGVWYVPLNVAGIQVAGQFPNLPMVVNFMVIGAVCGWLYHHTKSAILVAIMQVLVNYASLTFPVLPSAGNVGAYYAFIATKAALGIYLFAAFGPKPFFAARAPAHAAAESA